jgi:hypothetical protein
MNIICCSPCTAPDGNNLPFCPADSYSSLLDEALEQTLRYRDRFDKNIPAYLLIFDRRSESKKGSWDERIIWEENVEGVTVAGL